jgi:hypothetical protein
MKTQPNKSNVIHPGVTPHFLGLYLISAFLMLAGTGCKKSEAGSNTTIDPTGVYALVGVDGQNVPCSTTHEGHTMTIKSGVFTINGDGTCGSRITLSVPSRGDLNVDVKATYTRLGAELTMRWEGAGMTMGNVDGSAFTMTNEGMVFAYRK